METTVSIRRRQLASVSARRRKQFLGKFERNYEMKVFIFFILTFTAVHAYEIQGKLENISDEQIIKEADTFSAKLILWPYEAKDEDSFYDLVDKDILDFFFVSRVSKVVRSENNNQALEIYMTLVLKKFFVKSNFYIFNHRDLNIPVELVGITPERRQLKAQDFFVKEQKRVSENEYTIYLIGLLIIILLLGFYFFRKRKKVKVERKVFVVDKEMKTREEFELLYMNRDDLLLSYEDKNSEISKLLEEIDKIQYKPEWEDDELKSIKNYFQKIFNNSEEAQ